LSGLPFSSLGYLLEAYGTELFSEDLKGIGLAFDYIETRLTGACSGMFNCEHSYFICELMQLFDPPYIA
jgi:hypothetical protein